LYNAGSNLLILSHDTRAQRFVPLAGDGVSAMAASPNKRYLAVAERARGSAKPQISIYDVLSMRKRKVLVTPPHTQQTPPTREFVSLCFSPDSKYILAQASGPDWTLYYWAWEKSKVMASTRIVAPTHTNVVLPPSVTRVSFNPIDPSLVVASGQGVLRLLRYQEGQLRRIHEAIQPPHQNYITHCWITAPPPVATTAHPADRSLPSNAGGPSGSAAPPAPTGSPRAYLLLSTADPRLLLLDPADPDHPHRADLVLPTHPTTSLPLPVYALHPTARGILAGCSAGTKVLTCRLSPSPSQLDDAHLTPVMHSFHSLPITGLDTCVRKPLVATCSLDRSVRVWNYIEGTCEVAKVFAEEAFSIALHPSGLYVLVGFSDKLRMCCVLVDDVRVVREFTIRGCRECRFSTGGQFFAAVHGTTVQIFSTWTFDLLATLKGHSGKVRSLHWSSDDSKLVTAGIDGAVYEWALGGPKRDSESIVKSCNYTSAVLHPDGRSLFAVGSDRTLREIVESTVVREIESDVVYTQVAASHNGKMLFAGTAGGCVRAIKFPMAPGDTKSVEYAEHMAHAGAVSRMRVSHDDQYLFTAGEDGCVYVYKISDKEGRGKREREPIYADEVRGVSEGSTLMHNWLTVNKYCMLNVEDLSDEV
ncbi:WD40 repeat-like protein, partial [Gonapodya prolifera JEL478]